MTAPSTIASAERIGKVEMKNAHPMIVLSTKPFNEKIGLVIGLEIGLVIGLPMTHPESNESNPFAVKHVGPKGELACILTHRPRSVDWRERGARPHPRRRRPPAVFESVCEGLNSIMRICAQQTKGES